MINCYSFAHEALPSLLFVQWADHTPIYIANLLIAILNHLLGEWF